MSNEQPLIVGGVRLNRADVKKVEQKTVKNDYGAEKRHIITFKNGVVASYTGSAEAGSISSTIGRDEIAKTNVYGVMGLELSGSKKFRDEINVNRCEIIGIDVRDEGGYDEVSVKSSLSRDGSLFNANNYSALNTGKGPLSPTHGQIASDKSDNIQVDVKSSRSGISRL